MKVFIFLALKILLLAGKDSIQITSLLLNPKFEEKYMNWRNLSFGEALKAITLEYHDMPALIYNEEKFSYHELKQKIDGFSKGLIALGIRKGDRIALWLPNYPEWIIAQWAIAQIGSVLLPVNPRYRAYDLEYALNNAEVNTLILTDSFMKTDFLHIFGQICPDIINSFKGFYNCPRIPTLKNIIILRGQHKHPQQTFENVIELGKAVSDSQLQKTITKVTAKDMVYLLYTSGTTSTPKAAIRTHDNILQHAYDVGNNMGLRPKDKVLGVIPFCGAWGAATLIPSVFTHGACLVVQDDFNVEETFKLIQKWKIDCMHGVDVMFRAMLDSPLRKSHDISTLKKGLAALFSSSTDLMKEIIFDLEITYAIQALGMTETNALWLMPRYDDSAEMRINIIGGRPAPGLKAIVKNPLNGKELPKGEIGELCVQGYTVLPGYYKSDEATIAAFDEDGWFHTGDLGIRYDDNIFGYKGRLKEMYKSKGFNVTPREIEEFLQNHPKINAVGVVGVNDMILGEGGMAFIEPNQGAIIEPNEVLEYCRGKIASFKIPKYVIIWPILPRVEGPHGDKISKPKLQEIAEKEIARLKAEKEIDSLKKP